MWTQNVDNLALNQINYQNYEKNVILVVRVLITIFSKHNQLKQCLGYYYFFAAGFSVWCGVCVPKALWWRNLTPVGTHATGTPSVSVIYRVEFPLAYAVCTKPSL